MKRLIFAYFCFGTVFSAHAQFNAILYTLFPLTSDCEGGQPLGAYCSGTIYWDQNDNGPDPEDSPVPVGDLLGQANFNTFPLNGEEYVGVPGGFMTDPAFTISTTTPQPSRYFVIVECGDVRWTSGVLTIENGLNEYEVGGWTCEEFVVPCDVPTYIFTETINGVNYWADGPHSLCIPVCANLPVQICYGPLGPNVLPFATVRSGCSQGPGDCDSICEPAAAAFSNDAWYYDEANSLWCNWIYPGELDGCVCLRDYFNEVISPCDVPTYILTETVNGVDYWADGPHSSCIPVCADLPVQICYGPLGPNVLPFATVRSGCSQGLGDCDSLCEPAAAAFSNGAWYYDQANSLWCNWIYPGEQDGCICLEDSFSVAAPPCNVPTYIFTETVNGVDYWADGSHSSCIPVCADLPVQICYGPLGQDVIPFATVRPGCSQGLGDCDSLCEPAEAAFSNDAWVYDESNSQWCNWIYPGEQDGCICLEDSFSIAVPCDEPTYIFFETINGVEYWADGPHSSCIPVCANLPVQICYGPLGPNVLPFATVRSGCSPGLGDCDSLCEPATAAFSNDTWVYDESNSLWCNWIYPGEQDGCICLEDSFSIAVPCDEPTYIFFETVNGLDYWSDGPHYTCLSICAGQPVQICYGPIGQDILPIAAVHPGCAYGIGDCDAVCPPAEVTFSNWDWVYDEQDSLWCNWIVTGNQNGCVCLEDYFLYEYNIGFVESYFEALPRDNGALITWGTASESDIDYFRLRRDGLPVYTVAGTNSSTGSTYSFLDENVVNGRTYIYSLEVIDISGAIEAWTSVVEVTPSSASAVITEYALHQNYPNPFNSVTMINYDLPEQSDVSLVVYSVTGQLVAKLVAGLQTAGRHVVEFDGADLSSGVYFYTIQAGNGFHSTRSMQFVK